MKILCPMKQILTQLSSKKIVEGFQQCFLIKARDENITQIF